MRLWYLAHPVKADKFFTVQENLEHARKIQAILWNHNIAAIMPWYSYVVTYGAGEGNQLERCLEMDCEVVKLLHNIVIAGHRVSHGMQVELNTLNYDEHAGILDLVGLKDKDLSDYLDRKIIAGLLS